MDMDYGAEDPLTELRLSSLSPSVRYPAEAAAFRAMVQADRAA